MNKYNMKAKRMRNIQNKKTLDTYEINKGIRKEVPKPTKPINGKSPKQDRKKAKKDLKRYVGYTHREYNV
jgi:hypothetical protein